MNPVFIEAGLAAVVNLVQILYDHMNGKADSAEAQARWDKAVQNYQAASAKWDSAAGPDA